MNLNESAPEQEEYRDADDRWKDDDDATDGTMHVIVKDRGVDAVIYLLNGTQLVTHAIVPSVDRYLVAKSFCHRHNIKGFIEKRYYTV